MEYALGCARAFGACIDLRDEPRPPTEEHEGMKKFMLEQLETGRPYEYTPSKIVQRSGEDWRRDQIEHALKNIAYHAEGYAKEVERANSRTRWVRALRQSLAGLK